MKDTNAQPEEPQKPDYSAVSVIFDEYTPLIYKYVGRFCHDPQEADIIFAKVIVQFLEKLTLRKRLPSNPRIYLYRIAYDTIVKHLQGSGQKPPSFIKSLPSREEEREIIEATLSALNKELT